MRHGRMVTPSKLLLLVGVLIAGSSVQGQGKSVVTSLGFQQALEREIKGGEAHEYQFKLTPDECALIVVAQQGVNVQLRLLTAEGKLLTRINDGTTGDEGLRVVTETAAKFQLQVSPAQQNASVGTYRITWTERHPATAQDRDWFAGRRYYQEAIDLFNKGDSTSLQTGVEKCRQSVALFQSLGLTARIGGPLNLAGVTYSVLGDFEGSRRAYEQAVAAFQAVGDRRSEANSRKNLGNLYLDFGEYQRALDYFDQSFQIARETNFQDGIMANLDLLARAYMYLGDPLKARDLYQQLLTKAQAGESESDNQARLRDAYNGLGGAYSRLQEHQQALNSYTEALRVEPDRLGQAILLGNMAKSLMRAGDHPGALRHFQRALELNRALQYRTGEAKTLIELGNTYFALGQIEEAEKAFSQALPLVEALGLPKESPALHLGLARVYRARSNLGEALTQIKQAIALIEGQRTRIVSPDLRATFFATQREAYEFYLDLLVRLSTEQASEASIVTAFEMSERARARVFLELLRESSAQALAHDAPELAARERGLRYRIESKSNEQTRLRNVDASAAAKVAQELSLLLAEQDQLRTQIRQRLPRYASLLEPQPLTLPEIRQKVLDADTLLLEYALGAERSFLFAVTATTINTYILPARAEIETQARQWHALLSKIGKLPTFQSINEKLAWRLQQEKKAQIAAEALSLSLLAPVAELGRKKRLLIVADGALHYVPFAALPEPATARKRNEAKERKDLPSPIASSFRHPLSSLPLMVRHEILTLPSASTLAALRQGFTARRPALKTLAALADPVFDHHDDRVTVRQVARDAHAINLPINTDAQRSLEAVEGNESSLIRLPASRAEVEAIMPFVPPQERKIGFDFQASLATATSEELQQYRYLHFATHGLINNANPELSGLVFSLVNREGAAQDGFLRLLDVFNLKLNAELVVLSGCRTGLGKEVNGEGLLGLTRGFMYAGARRVVASLWNVNDGATAELMQRMYRGLLGKKNLSPAAALRAAQLEMWHDPRWQSPYYWAAFTMQGEW